MIYTIGIASAFLGLVLVASAPAQAEDETFPSAFETNYFENATTVGDFGILRIFNDHPLKGGPPICALIYVFNADQQMEECCSCEISGGGGSGALVAGLTSSPASGDPLDHGTIKIVSAVPKTTCGSGEEADPTAKVDPAISAWILHTYDATNGNHVNEEPFAETGEPRSDLTFLADICSVVQGPGEGVCFCPTDEPTGGPTGS